MLLYSLLFMCTVLCRQNIYDTGNIFDIKMLSWLQLKKTLEDESSDWTLFGMSYILRCGQKALYK